MFVQPWTLHGGLGIYHPNAERRGNDEARWRGRAWLCHNPYPKTESDLQEPLHVRQVRTHLFSINSHVPIVGVPGVVDHRAVHPVSAHHTQTTVPDREETLVLGKSVGAVPQAVVADVEHQLFAAKGVPERGAIVPVGTELGAALRLVVLIRTHVRQGASACEAREHRIFAHDEPPFFFFHLVQALLIADV